MGYFGPYLWGTPVLYSVFPSEGIVRKELHNQRFWVPSGGLFRGSDIVEIIASG